MPRVSGGEGDKMDDGEARKDMGTDGEGNYFAIAYNDEAHVRKKRRVSE